MYTTFDDKYYKTGMGQTTGANLSWVPTLSRAPDLDPCQQCVFVCLHSICGFFAEYLHNLCGVSTACLWSVWCVGGVSAMSAECLRLKMSQIQQICQGLLSLNSSVPCLHSTFRLVYDQLYFTCLYVHNKLCINTIKERQQYNKCTPISIIGKWLMWNGFMDFWWHELVRWSVRWSAFYK